MEGEFSSNEPGRNAQDKIESHSGYNENQNGNYTRNEQNWTFAGEKEVPTGESQHTFENTFGAAGALNANGSYDGTNTFDVPNSVIFSNQMRSPLSELRYIACREFEQMREEFPGRGETYFPPPGTPRRRPIDYLRELARAEVYRMLRDKIRETAHPDDLQFKSLQQIPSDGMEVKCFNDFDEGLFTFDQRTQRYECPAQDCTKAFPSLSRIKRHFIIHTDIKPFKCLNEECNRTFSRRDNMLQHYRMHCPHTLSK